MVDVTGRPLEKLAVEFKQRGYPATVNGETLVTQRGRVIVCDGRRFRWGGARGHVIGDVGAESAVAERAILVLRQIARGS
ncbi:hypothetical protein BZB76_0843 [Actinomadura pelletieri DSM 43383]|uniref:Uncharacterized protein n=1 Tax=Actinomadura pelletieri DSM 43383 TaxID=1120940 RepID=A0A495QZB2_9ACTN|nr:hypothetical protein [Actinomadura pelletieri]RKS79378.1 hypothetical protein BZB76_0843 [Actinomadura pelletieri DSM 43383]